MGIKQKILIVDDDPVFCSIVKEGLSTCGYYCQTAQSGEAAVELLKTAAFDLLLTDVIMPGMDGFELARCAEECSPNVAVVLMTGIPREDFCQRAKGFTAPFYIEKPFTLEQLDLAVDAVIQSRLATSAGASEA